MLTKAGELIDGLEAGGVRYCYLPNSGAHPRTLSGTIDVDLIICKKDASLFRSIVAGQFFKPAVKAYGKSFRSTEDYYGLDEKTGILVTVRAHFQMIAGEGLLRKYRLPLAQMLLENTRVVDSVRVPTKGAELVLYTLRMMMEPGQKWRMEAGVSMEADGLCDALALLDRFLPTFNKGFFCSRVEAIKCSAPPPWRTLLWRRARSLFRIDSNRSFFPSCLRGARRFPGVGSRGQRGREAAMRLATGGALIAFVGPEATGKSSLVDGVGEWLSEHFTVERIHSGKPPSTALSALPNRFAPFLRSRFPAYRPSRVTTKLENGRKDESKKTIPLVTALRSVLLAYDRRSLLERAFSRAQSGTIVLCDRFPSLINGVADGPSLGFLLTSKGRYSISALLARLEERLYRAIPGPDLILELSVPLEVALARNKTRGKEEPEDFVRLRHAQSSRMDFGRIPVYRVNTDRTFSETLLETKRAVWNAL